MRHANPRKQRAHQRVLMAIYRLADDDGLFCRATNMEVAVEAGVGIETARRHIHELEKSGDLTTFSNVGSNSHRREMILMDNPAAEVAVVSLMSAGRWLGSHSADARGVYEDGRPLTKERQLESF